jgi:hypothetical protein
MRTRHDPVADPDQFRQDGDGIGHAVLAWAGGRWFMGGSFIGAILASSS